MWKKETFLRHFSDQNRGAAFISLTTITVSFVGLFAKICARDVYVLLIVFLRFFIPFVLFIPFMVWKKFFFRSLFSKNLKNQLLKAGSLLISQYSIFYYLTEGSIFHATVFVNTAPLFIPFLEKLFFRTHIPKSTWACLMITWVGVMFVLPPNKDFFNPFTLVGLLAGLSQGAFFVFYGSDLKGEQNNINICNLYFWTSLISFIPILTLSIFKTDFMEDKLLMLKEASLLPKLSIVGIALASILIQFTTANAYRFAKPSHLAPFFYLGLLSSALLDRVVFGKIPSLAALFGLALIFLGSFLKFTHMRKNVFRDWI